MNEPPGASGHVLITGASTGIGRACAVLLAQHGFHVLAGVRTPEAAEQVYSVWQSRVERLGPGDVAGTVRSLVLDVSDDASIARATEHVQQIVGDHGLRALINNAGICVAGPVECVSLHDWRRQFEVNVFGAIAMTQRMLPLLRVYRLLHGRRRARIVMISSIAGRIAQPYVGAYCASKYALEAVGDAWRNELKPEGIGVCIVEPGAFTSEIWPKAIQQFSRMSLRGDGMDERYGRAVAAMGELAAAALAGARPAEQVARVVLDCLTRPRPPIRVLVGRDAKFVARLKAWLPDRWLDSCLRWMIDRRVRAMDAGSDGPPQDLRTPEARTPVDHESQSVV